MKTLIGSLLLACTITSCASFSTTPAISEAPYPLPQVMLTASPEPWNSFPITPNPNQVAMWEQYERAIAQKLIPANSSKDIVLCEWALLGQSASEIYIWAYCQVSGPMPTSTSAPAVIRIGVNNKIQSVEIPRDGSFYEQDVRRLFPPYVQEMILARVVNVETLRDHIYFREKNPEPPLIILSATAIP